jgi:ABC-2 type transport system ATP-binding protein
MEEAARLCDRVAILDKGKLLDVGSVDDLVDRHGGPATVEAEVTAGDAEESLRRETQAPLEEVARIAADAAARGAKLERLSVTRPDLEKVFLRLTGRSLRD